VKRLSNVLCAVDIAEPGQAAFAQALALARSHDAKLLIVHGVSPGRSFNIGAGERATHLRDLNARAQDAGVDVRVSVQSGEAAEIILLHARARQSGLIVVSAQHGKVNGRAFGSVAEDVLRGAECPTLIVPVRDNSPLLRGFDNALCAVDLSPDAESVIERVVALVDGIGHRLTLLHVVRDTTSVPAFSETPMLGKEFERDLAKVSLRRLQELIPGGRQATVLARVAMGRVVPEIVGAARSSHAVLVIVAARPRTRLGRRLFGVTRQLLRRAEWPVLAVPAHATAVSDQDVSRRAA
jgi:nucleotide-binding universal stress UspA family protein